MSVIAYLDFFACGASIVAILLVLVGFQRLPVQRDARYLLAGFLILHAGYHYGLFMEWSSTPRAEQFDRIENFIGTLTPMAWFLIVYSLVKEVAARDLRESEQKLRSFLDHHFEFTGIVDPEGRILLANKTALDYISATSEDIVGKLLWETPWLHNNEDARSRMIAHFKMAKGGRVSRFGAEMLADNDALRYFDISINPFMDTDGLLQWLVVEARDMTDLHKAQGVVEETLNLSKTILYKIDLRSQRFEYLSPFIESMTGFTATVFIERGLPWVTQRLHPDDIRRINRINRGISRRTIADGSDLEYELRFKGKDGTFDWYKARVTLRFDDQGKAKSVIGSIERITEQKKAEDILRKYEQIVSHTGDLLALVDDRYIFQAVSNSYLQFFGQTASQVIGSDIASVEGQHHFMTVTKPMMDRCLSGEEVNCQTWIMRPGQEQRYLDIHYFPYVDSEEGTITGFIISARDITSSQQLEEQLRQAHKMEAIGTLAGGIAHDFNNILAAIVGYSELGQSPTESKEALLRYMRKIHQAGQRAGDLVRQILTFSRQTKQEIKPLHLKPMIKEALKFIRASLPATIEIEQHLSSNALVLADPTQIHQIIMNMATNAAYAMKAEGGVLHIALEECDINETLASQYVDLVAGAYVCLTVSDTGIGMPSHIVERIFDPFYTTKPKEEGTGMGLSVVHGIVKSYKGAISVETEPGKGTTFNIFIPRIPDEHAGPLDYRKEDIPRGSERIMFVDDELPLLEIVQSTLERLGYQVVSISSGVEALSLFERDSQGFDLVITDLTMPGMTGDQLARSILKIRPDIPIIITTGFSESMTDRELAAIGHRRILYKPIIRKEIAEAIRDVLDGQRSNTL